jgi:hypothetical protein
MPAPIPADWEEFYRIAAAKEAADGNGKACRTLLRYARIERVRATLSGMGFGPARRTSLSRVRRQPAGGGDASPGPLPLFSYPIHSGANAPIAE